MSVLLLRQIERELIVNRQIVVARALARIAVIVIGCVAFLATIARQTFGIAIAFGRFVIAMRRLSVAFAPLTNATVHRITPPARSAAFAIRAYGYIAARLAARSAVRLADAVPIALTTRTMREMPAFGRTLERAVRNADLSALGINGCCVGDNTIVTVFVEQWLLD